MELADLGAVLLPWMLGALVGWLLPRPRTVGLGTSVLLRRGAVVVYCIVFLRQVWRLLTHPGTFHALVRAVATACTGGGWAFAWPEWAADGRALGHSASALSTSRSASSGGALVSAEDDEALAAAAAAASGGGNGGADSAAEAADPTYFGAHPDPDWDRRVLSAEKELAFFKHRAIDGGEVPGVGEWELMMDKDLPMRLRYTAWRRTLPDGKTEYKSITIAPDSHPEEANDLFFDDNFRARGILPVDAAAGATTGTGGWDGMVTQHSVLENGDFDRRQQVVRWVRRFPFAFLSDREYAIGRCMVREPASAWRPSAALTPGAATPSLDAPTLSSEVLYGLTRGVRHPREDRRTRVVRMDVFWSHWRSRGVPCPWGGRGMACETVLLHHEQFKIPENLARFAVRHGMWGFVRSLNTKTAQFVASRRERVLPDARDPLAYGGASAPDPPTADEVARAEAEEAALAAAAAGKGGGKGGKGGAGSSSRQGSLQVALPDHLLLPPAGAAAAALSAEDAAAAASADTPPQIARTPSQAFSVASSEGTTASEAAASAAAAGAADPAFVSWAHSAPVVARLRGALPMAPPGAISIHHSLSNASVAGLATVPSMVWSKIARVGSFGAGLAAMAAASAAAAGGGGSGGGGTGGGGGGHDADGTDSVVDFGGEGGEHDAPSGRATSHGGRDQTGGGGGGLGSPDAFVSVRPPGSSSGGGGSLGRSVSFARLSAGGKAGGGGSSGGGAAAAFTLEQQQQLRLAHQQAFSADAERYEQEVARVRRRRRAAAAVLAAGAIALAVGGGGGGGSGLGSGGRRRVVAALPSPAEEQRRRRERQRQHHELRRVERERQEAKPKQQQPQQRPQSAPLKAFPPLRSFPV